MHHRNSPHTAEFSRYSATPHVCRCDSSATSLSTKCTNALVSLTCRHVFVGFVCVFVLAFLRPDRPRGAWKPEKNHITLLTRSAEKIISASRKLAFRIGQNSPTPQVFDALNTFWRILDLHWQGFEVRALRKSRMVWSGESQWGARVRSGNANQDMKGSEGAG